MSETDSFIEEVTEEVRRDRLYKVFRRYSWVAALGVVLVVGGASFNEWRKARDTADAQALGDAIVAALDLQEPAARNQALGEITAGSTEAQPLIDILRAATAIESGDREGALALLDGVASDPDATDAYRSLAQIKAAVLRGGNQNADERLAALSILAQPGQPFRVLAMEQQALVHAETGNNNDAIEVLLQILVEPQTTGPLRSRVQQLIVVLGGSVPATHTTTGQEN